MSNANSISAALKEMSRQMKDMAANVTGLESEVEHWKRVAGEDTTVKQEIRRLKEENLALQSRNDHLAGRIKTYKATLRAAGLTEPV
jgi:regulator of replication initiation timing